LQNDRVVVATGLLIDGVVKLDLVTEDDQVGIQDELGLLLLLRSLLDYD